MVAIISHEDFAIDGTLNEYQTTSEDGNSVSRKFCPQCGSPVLNIPHGYPGIAALNAGSLDDPALVTPQAHIWTRSMQPWIKLDDDLISDSKPA